MAIITNTLPNSYPMTTSLRTRLILSYLAIALLTATLIYLLIRATSDQRLKTLVLEQQISEMEEQVIAWYALEGSWEGFESYFKTLHPPDAILTGSDGDRRTPPDGAHGVVSADGEVLIRFEEFRPGDSVPDAFLVDALPIVVDEQTVGWIVPDDGTGLSLAGEETVYLQRTNQVVLIAGLVGVGVALVMGLGLARVLLRPIDALTQASERMAQGDLKQQVPVQRDDELGKLATSFNSMSNEIALANQKRQQLTADIAHDLSTPLQIVSGYVEAIQDGDLAPTAERMEIIATELDHLRHLIEDLDLLAQTDTKTLRLQIEPLNLADFLPQTIASFKSLAADRKIDLELSRLPSKLPAVQADRERLTQVLGNILNNALRHTPAGGSIDVNVMQREDSVQIGVRDNGEGISAETLPFIFDRFYQTDRQRSNAGKMGLGLAISKGLIEAMGGGISADRNESSDQSHSHDRGTTFVVTLPI